MMEDAKEYLVDRRATDEFEGVRQEAEKLIAATEVYEEQWEDRPTGAGKRIQAFRLFNNLV